MPRTIPLITTAALCTLIGLLAGTLLPTIASTDTPQTTTPSHTTLLPSELHAIQLFEKTADKTVFITTTALRRDFWTMRTTEVKAGSGSGFFWDDQGHVVTNYHVIESANTANVILCNGEQLAATLVGASPRHDLAVLKIESNTQPGALPLGDSQILRPGQNVYAIGNPFGFDHTYTTGIVSALKRNISGRNGSIIEDVIQTDAAINPGNSGGPLINSKGELIGINTAIYSPTGTNSGIGFAIPINTLKRVIPQLIEQGQYNPPSLGVQSHPQLSASVCQKLGIEGLLIVKVQKGSSAEKIKLQETIIRSRTSVTPGDILLSVGNDAVKNADDLLRILDRHKTGDTVRLKIWRNKKIIELECELQ